MLTWDSTDAGDFGGSMFACGSSAVACATSVPGTFVAPTARARGRGSGEGETTPDHQTSGVGDGDVRSARARRRRQQHPLSHGVGDNASTAAVSSLRRARTRCTSGGGGGWWLTSQAVHCVGWRKKELALPSLANGLCLGARRLRRCEAPLAPALIVLRDDVPSAIGGAVGVGGRSRRTLGTTRVCREPSELNGLAKTLAHPIAVTRDDLRRTVQRFLIQHRTPTLCTHTLLTFLLYQSIGNRVIPPLPPSFLQPWLWLLSSARFCAYRHRHRHRQHKVAVAVA